MNVLRLIWSTSTHYIKDSSIAGLSHAAKSRNWIQCAYWLTIFALGLGFTVRSIVELITNYYSYPINALSDLRHESSVTFPAVTVCNLNRINCLNLLETTEQLRSEDDPRNDEDLEHLDQLFDITGCRHQVCSYLSVKVPDVRNNSRHDGQALIMAYLRCGAKTGVASDFQKNCYYLKQMKDFDPNLTDEDLFSAGNLWNATQCTLPDACKHYQKPFEALVFVQQQFVSGKEIEVECLIEGLVGLNMTGGSVTLPQFIPGIGVGFPGANPATTKPTTVTFYPNINATVMSTTRSSTTTTSQAPISDNDTTGTTAPTSLTSAATSPTTGETPAGSTEILSNETPTSTAGSFTLSTTTPTISTTRAASTPTTLTTTTALKTTGTITSKAITIQGPSTFTTTITTTQTTASSSSTFEPTTVTTTLAETTTASQTTDTSPTSSTTATSLTSPITVTTETTTMSTTTETATTSTTTETATTSTTTETTTIPTIPPPTTSPTTLTTATTETTRSTTAETTTTMSLTTATTTIISTSTTTPTTTRTTITTITTPITSFTTETATTKTTTKTTTTTTSTTTPIATTATETTPTTTASTTTIATTTATTTAVVPIITLPPIVPPVVPLTTLPPVTLPPVPATLPPAPPAPPSFPWGRRRKRNASFLDSFGDMPQLTPPQLDFHSDSGMVIDAQTLQEDKFLQVFMTLSPRLRAQIGHSFASVSGIFANITGMFSDCSFRGSKCLNESLWKRINLPSFGNCFMFNSDLDQDQSYQAKNATLTGAANGMSLELFLDQDAYMLKGLSQKAGVRLIVHNPATFPLAEEFGIDLEPNTANSVAIQMNKIKRLPFPYPSDCIEHWDQTNRNQSLMVSSKPTYSRGGCYRHCLQLDVIQECHCYHTNLDMSLMNLTLMASLVDLENQTSIIPCSLIPDETTNPDFVCFKKVFDEFDIGVRECSDCVVSCLDVEYTTSIASSKWPSNQYWPQLALNLGFSNQDISQSQRSGQGLQRKIQENYLKLDVYYQTFNVRSVTEAPEYSGESLFAALGGALSFYLGVAIVMAFELVELLLEVLIAVWQHLTTRKK